jgi:hypothetical protein
LPGTSTRGRWSASAAAEPAVRAAARPGAPPVPRDEVSQVSCCFLAGKEYTKNWENKEKYCPYSLNSDSSVSMLLFDELCVRACACVPRSWGNCLTSGLTIPPRGRGRGI